jgi:hypothetical protein
MYYKHRSKVKQYLEENSAAECTLKVFSRSCAFDYSFFTFVSTVIGRGTMFFEIIHRATPYSNLSLSVIFLVPQASSSILIDR